MFIVGYIGSDSISSICCKTCCTACCTTNRQEIEPVEFEQYRVCHARLPLAHHCQMCSKHQTSCCRSLYRTRRLLVCLCAVEKFSSSIIWDKVPEGSILIFADTLLSLKHNIAYVKRNLCAKKSARYMQPIQYNTGVSQTDRHTTTANIHASNSIVSRG